MEVLIILGAIILIGVAAGAASRFGDIAEMKGHDRSPYFWWSFLVPIAGMLMVIALPDRAAAASKPAEPRAAAATAADDELPDL